MKINQIKGLAYGTLLIATLSVMLAATASVWLQKTRERAEAWQAAEIRCLAENVYFESRGEPLVGQYAVAEVTMNRVVSADFPNSVCEVVNQTGAFSWTYSTSLTPPYGFEWRRARAVASSVYLNAEAQLVQGALFYHATYVSPDWAASRRQVALIGRHLFYL
ncbi:MAG: cell wall hydrolase [Gammaproteobacteria bacterium]